MSKKTPNKVKSNQVAPKSTTPAKKGITNAKNLMQTKSNTAPVNAKQEEKIENRPTSAPKPPPLTEEQKKLYLSATRIQTKWRKYKAQKQLKSLKQEKNELDEKLRKLEQEAFIQMVKIEQEREEKKRLKQLKEKQIKQKREARKKKFLEAAFDGNIQDIKFLISDLEKELNSMNNENEEPLDNSKKKQTILNLIDCRDMNNNSALSEAAAGGSGEVVKFLLSSNADPNSKGAFGRTPLWRSSFGGHLNCVQILLENGADPRMYSTDGQRVADAATNDNVINLLENWNIQLTDRMLQQIEKTKMEFKQEQMQSLESRKKAAQNDYEKINSQYETVKNELYKCNCELQRLNDEWDLNKELYGQLIDKKEAEKIEITARYDELREKTFKARIFFKDALHDFNKEKRQLKKKEDEKEENNSDSESEETEEKITQINIREFDDMILRDLSGLIKNSTEKWPLIIDQNDQASTFLRYRDTNYINCLDMQSMQGEKFRRSLIGAIRYGKPFVLDLMQYDQELIESVKIVCGQISYPNLFEDLCSKQLMHKDNFMRLVKLESDGKEYEHHNFNEIRLKNFKILFLTANPYPNDKLMKLTMPIKIVTSKTPSADDDF